MKMKCNEFEVLIDAYVDGELKETEAFEAHMASCPECQLAYEETLEIKQLLEDLDEVALPDDFEATLHDKLVQVSNEMKVVPFYRHPLIKVVSSVAAMGLVSILAFKAGTLVPMDQGTDVNDTNVAYDMAFNVSAENDMAVESFMADEEMAEDEPTLAMDDGEELGNAKVYTTSAAVRFSVQPSVLAQEEINFIVDGPELSLVLSWLENYQTEEILIEDGQLKFYLPIKDLDLFKEQLYSEYYVDSEIVLDYSDLIRDIESNYKSLIESSEENEESNNQINALSDQVSKIKQYETYQYIVITMIKE